METVDVDNLKVGFCTMEQFDNREKNSVGSSRIRGRWLWEKWENAEQYVIGKQYDVMIFQKVYWDEMMKRFEGIKILDLCDPDWLEGRDVMKYASLCDAVVTSTQALADYISKFIQGIPVICIPDRINLDEHEPRGEHTGAPKKIAWMGYSQNFHYIYPTLEFLNEHKLELVVMAPQAYTPPVGFEFAKVVNVVWQYPSVHKYVAECDLYLAPETVTADEKGKYKSNNKPLSAWALGVPVVKTPEDLERFKDPVERNKEMQVRLQEIRDKWDVKYSIEEYKSLINEILKAKRKAPKK